MSLRQSIKQFVDSFRSPESTLDELQTVTAERLDRQDEQTGEWVLVSNQIAVNSSGYGRFRRTSWFSDGTSESHIFEQHAGVFVFGF